MKRAVGFGCLAFLAAATFSGAMGWLVAGALLSRSERGEVRVVIASRDVEEQGTVTGDDLAELPLPARHSNRAMIPSDDAPRLVGRKLPETTGGTALTWSLFADRVRAERAAACTEAIGQEFGPELTEAIEGVLAQVRPAPARDTPLPRGEVLVLAREVKPGTVLVESDLATARIPAELITASWIEASRLAEVVGSSVVTKLGAGEPLWWQMLEPANAAPGTLGSCLAHVEDAETKLRQRLAPSAAKAWVEREANSW